jgi:hypothetical protein
MRIRLSLILVVLWLVVGLVMEPGVLAAALAAKDYSADRYDVNVTVEEGGDLFVKETFVFRFAGGPFTRVFREIPTDETDGITDVSASMDGIALPLGSATGQVEIDYGRRVKVVWHLPPTSDDIHIFVLAYHMLGVIRQQDGSDVLSYRPLPTDHDYLIASSTVRFTYPASAQLLDQPAMTRGQSEIGSAPGQVTLLSHNLGKNDYLQVLLRFAPGSLTTAPPQWQVLQSQQNSRAPAFIALAAAILSAGTAAFVAYTRRHRRDIEPEKAGDLQITRPPSELAPALAGMVKDNAADPVWQYALGTLLSLGQRGIVTIEESAQHSWFRQRDFIMRLQTTPQDLSPHEDALLRLFFDSKSGMMDSVKLSEVSGRTSLWGLVSKAMQQEMRDAGLLSPQREAIRRKIMIAAVLVMVVGAVAMLAAIPLVRALGGWGFLVGASLMALGLVGVIAGGAFSPQSDKAALQKPRWDAFARFLKDVAKGNQPFVGAKTMEEYIPYAASLGLAQEWAGLFKQLKADEAFGWFRPLASADGGSSAFVAMIAVSSSAPGSAGGGAAGGGAAGGGSSGAS